MRTFFATTVCAVGLLLAAHAAQAQTIGFKLGMTSSEFALSDTDEDEIGLDRLSSLGVGGFVRFGMAGLQLQVEALGVTKGAKINDLFGDDDGKLKLDYVEIPVTAMITFGNGPYVFGGGAVAFEVGCSFEGEIGGTEFEEDCDDDDPDADTFQRKETDVGVLVGAGFQFAAGPGSLLIEARHTWGLTNLVDGDGFEGTPSIKNRAFAIFAGYAIPIGRR